MTDLFGTPEGKREDRDEYRVIVNGYVQEDVRGPFPTIETAEQSCAQYAPWVRWRIEHRTVTTYTTPWRKDLS